MDGLGDLSDEDIAIDFVSDDEETDKEDTKADPMLEQIR